MPTLDFRGRSFIVRHHDVLPHHTLVPHADLSVLSGDAPAPPLDGNLIVEGDNLLALQALLPYYRGRVKCIYIDPPYNTGNEHWVYNDNVSGALFKEWLGQEVGPQGEDFNRHDKWCCMMYPRLMLLKELLRDDGVIFVSIDDNEVHHLRMLMDEIFGEENFIADVVWKKKTNGNNMGVVPPVHDFVIVYAKSLEIKQSLNELPLSSQYIATNYANPDNDPRGEWTTSDLSANHVGPHFPITNPNTGEIYLPAAGRYWVFNEAEVQKRIADGRIIFGKRGKTAPVQKVYKGDRTLTVKSETLWDDAGFNSDGTGEVARIIDVKAFETPKPVSLLTRILKLATTNGNQREPTGTNGNQREPTGTNGNQREPTGTRWFGGGRYNS